MYIRSIYVSKNREIYFEKYCRPAKTPEQYIMALHNSPYRTHKRMAILLIPELDKLIEGRAKQVEAEQRQQELDDFERKLKL